MPATRWTASVSYTHLTRKPYPGEDVEILLSDADPRNGILGAAYSALEGLKTGVCIKEERRMSI